MLWNLDQHHGPSPGIGAEVPGGDTLCQELPCFLLHLSLQQPWLRQGCSTQYHQQCS